MATCTPQALPRDSTCFHCIPPDAKRVLKLYLLNALSNSQTALQLSQAAAQYRPIDNKLALAAKVYLLSVISGVSPTAATLEASAKCYQCIPPSARLDVETYLTAVSAAISLDPATLTRLIGPYKSLYPIRDQVEIYLLNFMAGGKTIAQIMTGAKCLTCLGTPRLEEIYIQLLCGGLMPNLIPVGSVYSGGATPEFDLTVLTNTSYLIIWGTNDVSMVLCGVTYPNTGAGTTTVIANTGACSVMQFFGFFGGTTVTVRVQKIPTPIPAPTGFTWVVSGANAIASWNAPPAGVFSTELWTSTDNITFSLAATVVTPGTSATVAGPSAGQTIYAKIRFTSKVFPGYSAFTAVLSVSGVVFDPVVTDWSNRVQANGGAVPSNNTLLALNTFVGTLKGAGVWTKIATCNFYAPDSLIAAITPLVVGIGVDPWTNHNFVAGDLTVNGLIGDGSTKYLETGYNPNAGGSILTTTSNGIVAYIFTDNTNGVQSSMGAYGPGAGPLFGLLTHYNVNQTLFADWSYNGGASDSLTWASPVPATGYFSGQRTAINAASVYFANSTNAHAALVSTAIVMGTSIVGHPVLAFADDQSVSALPPNDFSRKRESFHALTSGLSSADDSVLFSAVQALRTSLGGGFI